jgi:hypothetical protein
MHAKSRLGGFDSHPSWALHHFDRRIYPAAAVIFRPATSADEYLENENSTSDAKEKAAGLTPSGGVKTREWMGQRPRARTLNSWTAARGIQFNPVEL